MWRITGLSRRKQDDDVVKDHRRKRDARRRKKETSESYQAALNAARREYPAIQAVATARRAVIAGDRGAVDQLLTKWLHLPISERWRAAVEMALMDDALKPARLDEHCLSLLRALARSEHRSLLPFWRRRSHAGRIVRLSEQMGIGVADDNGPEAVLLNSEIGDERLASVLEGLTQQEMQLVQAWVELGGSWEEAATSQGMTAQTGEQTRRKLRRRAQAVTR